MPDIHTNSWLTLLQCNEKRIISSAYIEYRGVGELVNNIKKHDFGVCNIEFGSVEWVSMADALHLLTCSSRSEVVAEAALKNAIEMQKVYCTQASDSPIESLSNMSGKIEDLQNNKDFWSYVWTNVARLRSFISSTPRLDWLFKGGILFERNDIDCLSAYLVRQRVNEESATCRRLHPQFLQITDLIGIELRKKQKEFCNDIIIDFKEKFAWDEFIQVSCKNPISFFSSEIKLEIVERIFYKIKSLIRSGMLKPLIFDCMNDDLRDCEFDDLVGVFPIFCSHSFGLLGGDAADKFLLFRKSNAFLGMGWDIVEDRKPEKRKGQPGRPKGTTYNDEFFVNECLSRIASGRFSSRRKAILDVIDNYQEIEGNNVAAKESRLSEHVRQKLGPVQRKSSAP